MVDDYRVPSEPSLPQQHSIAGVPTPGELVGDEGDDVRLTADHSVEAWKRKAAGKVIRLRDISVVCRRCNSERGAARGEKASDQWRKTWGEGVAEDVLDRRAKAKFPTDCESFSTEEVG